MIRLATSEDYSIIKKIWKSSFFDTDSYIDFYWQYRFPNSYAVLYEPDGATVGMIHLLPCKLFPDIKAMYWYAAAILPEKRGRGYFSQFASQLRTSLREHGYFSICLPAPGLEKIYQKIGMNTAYCSQDIDYIGNANKTEIGIKVAHPDDFLNLEQQMGDTTWSRSAIEYAIAENEFCNGTSFYFQYNKRSFVGLAIKQEDAFVLDSTNITHKDMVVFQNSLLKYLNCKTIRLRGNVVNTTLKTISGLTDFSPIGENSKLFFPLA